MRKLILNLAVSLDGFIEGPNGEYDWCFTDQDYGMKALLKRIDTIFFGRKSYQLLCSTEKNPYPAMAKYLFSNSLKSLDGGILVNGDVEHRVREIKNQKGKDVWLYCGAQLTNNLLRLNLIDEIQLAVHPLLLGNGRPLFGNLDERVSFILIDVKTYSTGLVQLFYERPRMRAKL
jgi:dihydrofolate reductase